MFVATGAELSFFGSFRAKLCLGCLGGSVRFKTNRVGGERKFLTLDPCTPPHLPIPPREARGCCPDATLRRVGPARTRPACWGHPRNASPLSSPSPRGGYRPSCSAGNSAQGKGKESEVAQHMKKARVHRWLSCFGSTTAGVAGCSLKISPGHSHIFSYT